MDQYEPFRWGIYLFLIYSTVGVIAWGFRVRRVNGQFELRFPLRRLWVVLGASVIMLVGMIPAFFFHLIGYALFLVGASEENFIGAILLIYFQDPLPFVPISNLSVLLAALAVWAFVNQYDTRHSAVQPLANG